MIKDFLKRGVLFSGLGPLIYGIVILIIDLCGVEVRCSGIDIFKAIISTTIMAFLIAGVSVVWQNERLGLGYASIIHGMTLYISYLLVYLVNNWIPRSIFSISLFSGIFVVTYLVVWLIVYLIQKSIARSLNRKLQG